MTREIIYISIIALCCSCSNQDDYIRDVFVDIEIPIREVCHLAFVLDQKVLNIYVNGELSQIAKFMGEPVSNNLDMNFTLKNSFGGNLIDWNYFPDTISHKKVKILSSTLPDFDGVPKKKKVKNHLNQGNYGKAIKSMF